MIIDKIRIFSYSLPFLTPLKIKDRTFNFREGYLIRISNKNDNIGWGEISPLYGFSIETLESVLSDIINLKQKLENFQVPQEILKILFPYSPSVRFGFESALLNLMASEKKLTLAGFLNPTANLKIKINALLDGNYDDIIKKTENELGEKGRVLVRYSGTQNVCRVMVEGPDEDLTHHFCKEIAEVVQTCLG